MAGRRAIRSVKSIEQKKKRLKKREVLSYEDIPIDEYDENAELPKVKITQKTKQVLLIVFVLVLVMIMWVNWSNLQPKNVVSWVQNSVLGISTGEGFPLPIRGTQVEKENFKLMGDEALAVSDTSVVILNKTAKETRNTQHSFNKPASAVGGGVSIIYNRGGNGYQIESNSGNQKKMNTSEPIISACISSSGNYAVVTQAKDYLAALTVYDRDHVERYKYSFSDSYVTDIDINSAGNQVAVATIQTVNGQVNTILYVLDISTTTPKLKQEIPGNMSVSADYLSNENVAVIGDSFASVVETSAGKRKDYSYNKRMLMSYTVNPEIGIGLALSSASDGRNCEFVLIDSGGTTHAEFPTPYKAISLALKGNTIAMLSDGNIQAYNTKGENWNSVPVGSDAKKILLYGAKSAYVLGVSEIRHANI